MRRKITALATVLALALLLAALTACGGGSDSGSNVTPPAEPAGGNAAEPGAAGGTQPADDVPVARPEAPADVSGMQEWLDTAFPDSSWTGRIKKIEHVPGEVPDSGGFANAIVVTTDLDFATEQSIGTDIANALGEANVTWAKQYVVRFADGNNITAGDLVDMTP